MWFIAGYKEGNGWVIQRSKIKITHSSYLVRKKIWQLEIKNLGKEQNDFVMVIQEFLPGLSITDGEGNNLSFLPTTKVEEEVGDREKFLEDMVADREYDVGGSSDARILWINLARSVAKGEIIIICLSFEDVDEVSEGPWLIRHPKYMIGENKTAEPYDTFVEIRIGGEGGLKLLNTKGLPEESGEKGSDGAVYNQWPRFLQVRARALTEGVELEYSIHPPLRETLLTVLFFLILSAVPLVVFLLVLAGIEPKGSFIQDVSLFGGTLSLVAMGLLPASQVNRLWYLGPFVLYLVLLFLSTW